LHATQFTNASLVPANTLRRIPDGAASLKWGKEDALAPAQYVELGKYGLFFVARQFGIIDWSGTDKRKQLYFAGLFQTLLRLIVLGERFYCAHSYHGGVLLNISLHHVQGETMRFIATDNEFDDDAEEFRCFTDSVSTERRLTVDEIKAERLGVLTETLTDLTWAFWQSNQDHPTERLRQNVQRMMQQIVL
jgi:hypothetical protein